MSRSVLGPTIYAQGGWGSAVQNVVEVDPTANSHWSSLEWALTLAQSEGPNSHWLLSVWWAGPGGAGLRWEQQRVGYALRQGRLVEAIPR